MTGFRLDDLKFDTSGKAKALGAYEFGQNYSVGMDRTFTGLGIRKSNCNMYCEGHCEWNVGDCDYNPEQCTGD